MASIPHYRDVTTAPQHREHTTLTADLPSEPADPDLYPSHRDQWAYSESHMETYNEPYMEPYIHKCASDTVAPRKQKK